MDIYDIFLDFDWFKYTCH